MMNNNIDISKVIVDSKKFVDTATMHSLEKVSEEIQQTMDVINSYKSKVESNQPPVVHGEPWYKFSFGKASVTKVNEVLKSFSDFVQETFKMIAISQKFQNENDMNICRLIGLLALAESNTYSKIKALTTEDENSLKKLKEIEEKLLQSINDANTDNGKKEEQMQYLINYITHFSESKTIHLRSITLELSEIKTRLNNYCIVQDNWIADCNTKIINWQNTTYKQLIETNKKIEEDLNKLCNRTIKSIDENFELTNNKLTEKAKVLHTEIQKTIDYQITKTDNCIKNIDKEIIQYKLVIEEQNKLINAQSESIKEQNKKIRNIKHKVNGTLIIATLSLLITLLSIIDIF